LNYDLMLWNMFRKVFGISKWEMCFKRKKGRM